MMTFGFVIIVEKKQLWWKIKYTILRGKVMENFSYEELRLIRFAIETEIMRREENPLVNPKKLAEFEDLYDKVDNLIKDIRSNRT